jgi:hypothetical protein
MDVSESVAAFDPPAMLAVAFVALTLAVVAVDVALVRRAAAAGQAWRWTVLASIAACFWLVLHAGLAASGILEGDRIPPPVMFYLVATLGVGVGVALSPVGGRLAALPVGLLVGVQAFRLPLEWLLHALYLAGALPVQMTWNGANFDVVTGASAALLGLWSLRHSLPAWVVWVWNVCGAALLINVVTIAVLSAPLPFRRFLAEPAVVLVFHPPFNWIVNVHVWTAFVGHLIVFRALWARRHHARS